LAAWGSASGIYPQIRFAASRPDLINPALILDDHLATLKRGG
jgi:hypothetical protein